MRVVDGLEKKTSCEFLSWSSSNRGYQLSCTMEAIWGRRRGAFTGTVMLKVPPNKDKLSTGFKSEGYSRESVQEK